MHDDQLWYFRRLRLAIDWWMAEAIERDGDEAAEDLWDTDEYGRRIHMRWGVVLHAREISPDRWIWVATTAGGETVPVTGALLEIMSCHPVWLWGQPGAVYRVTDPTHVLEENQPASHLALTHVVSSMPAATSTEIRSYHFAD